MPTPIEILLDLVSLVVIAMYAGLLLFKDINKNRPEPPRRLTAGGGAF